MSTNKARQPERKTRPVARKRIWGGRALLYLAFIVAILYSLFPPIAMAADTVGANIAALIAIIGGAPIVRGAFYFTPVYYQDALSLAAFPSRALNSLAIGALSVGAALAVGIPVSYILARVDIKGKGAISFVLIALRTISPFTVVLPLYIFFVRVGLWDTYQGVALAELLFVLTVVVWMVKGFFADIPRQVYDAASVFASSEGQIFRQVALPLVAGGVAVTAIFGIVLIWNEFLTSFILTGLHTKSVAVGVWTGMGDLGEENNTQAFVVLETAATVAYLPALAVMLAIRKYLAKGFSLATAR
jgi:multiple sugar transport system permease protein